MKTCRWGWHGVVWMGVCTAFVASADPARGQTPAEAMAELVGYDLEGDGRWRQDNPEFTSGSDVPAYWVRQLAWGPARDVVITDAFAVYEDGRCEPIAHMVYYWDIRQSRVAVQSFNAGGVVAEGYLEALSSSEVQLVATIRLPDRQHLRIRDRTERRRPDQYTTRAERWVDGAWVGGDTVTWRRDSAVGPCIVRSD